MRSAIIDMTTNSSMSVKPRMRVYILDPFCSQRELFELPTCRMGCGLPQLSAADETVLFLVSICISLWMSICELNFVLRQPNKLGGGKLGRTADINNSFFKTRLPQPSKDFVYFIVPPKALDSHPKADKHVTKATFATARCRIRLRRPFPSAASGLREAGPGRPMQTARASPVRVLPCSPAESE